MTIHLDQDLVIRSLTADELDVFGAVTATAPDAERWLAELTTGVQQGHTRPEWCFVATRGDEVVGRVSYWTYRGHDEPISTWHVETESTVAGAILRATQVSLGSAEPGHEIILPAGQHPTTHASREQEVLLEAGFTLELERLLVELDAEGAPDFPDSGRLTYLPARDLERDDLIDVLKRIAVGSLDHTTRMEIEQHGADWEASEAHKHLLNLDAEPDWFVVGYRDGEPVGLVVPNLGAAGLARTYIGYIGVLAEHRGNGYVDDLLARGTSTLLAAGASHVLANTDVANIPMAAAFARAGYSENRRVYRYYWNAD